MNREETSAVDVQVQRIGDNYSLRCPPHSEQAFDVYSSFCPNTFSDEKPVAKVEAGDEVFIKPQQNRRHYFHCIDASGNVNTVAERHLPLEGTPNFRDFGGYAAKDGRRVRWGKLFRSGQLSNLTDNDLQYMESLDVKLVCDFRRDEERERDPSVFPNSAQPDIIGLPIDPGSTTGFVDNIARGDLSAEDMASFMCDINREFALDQAPVYKTMFAHILKLDSGASLVHCAAGKDRTGFAVAVVLAALGVARDTIMADYMLTSQYFSVENEIDRISKKYQWGGANDVMRPMLETREPYLLTAFKAIDQHFSDINEYLDVMLGVGADERDALCRRYLF